MRTKSTTDGGCRGRFTVRVAPNRSTGDFPGQTWELVQARICVMATSSAESQYSTSMRLAPGRGSGRWPRGRPVRPLPLELRDRCPAAAPPKSDPGSRDALWRRVHLQHVVCRGRARHLVESSRHSECRLAVSSKLRCRARRLGHGVP